MMYESPPLHPHRSDYRGNHSHVPGTGVGTAYNLNIYDTPTTTTAGRTR